MLGVFASGPLLWIVMIPLVLVLGLYRLISPHKARDLADEPEGRTRA